MTKPEQETKIYIAGEDFFCGDPIKIDPKTGELVHILGSEFNSPVCIGAAFRNIAKGEQVEYNRYGSKDIVTMETEFKIQDDNQ